MRIRRYSLTLRQHLTDRDLSAGKIAHERHISVRHLYNLWAHHDMSLGRWITRERLEGVRRGLAGPRSRAATVAATAHRWGLRRPRALLPQVP
jgi:AraC-like DNA-binding protein